MKMKALTLWEPWASLVARGYKKIETRSWSTSYRGVLAIHAAKTTRYLDQSGRLWRHAGMSGPVDLPAPGEWPVGKVLAVCNLEQCVPTETLVSGALSRREYAFGDYSLGRWAWLFSDVRILLPYVRGKGARGLWEVSPELRHKINLVQCNSVAGSAFGNPVDMLSRGISER